MMSTDAGHLEGQEAPTDVVFEFCHDLRQPLATVLALVAACRTEPDLQPGVIRRLRQIQAEASHMAEMVERKVNTAMAPRPIDASRVAAEVVDAAGPIYKGTLEFDGVPDATVLADEMTLRRAVSNLIENAARAAGPDGTVSVTVGRRGRQIRLDVEDSGPGFGSGPPGAGGLGLVIVERLVRTHGGHLEILRSRLGGALMRVSLPAPNDTRKPTNKQVLP